MRQFRLLVAESETAEQRDARRERAGKSSGESYRATLFQLAPGATVDLVAPADEDADPPGPEALAGYDAVFLTGSPLHVYCDIPPVRRHLDFMRDVFRSGTPSFGSCAGLQVAVAAAGGVVRPMPRRTEAGIARRITRTEAGRNHPLLAGRPAAWDAFTIHGDEVEQLPPGGAVLATNSACRVQAAEIRHDRGVFWGVQTHPELAPGEIAVALRSQADELCEAGLLGRPEDVEAQAAPLERLQHEPDHAPSRWALGIDDEVAVEANRRRELDNFLDRFVRS